ncbi:hypothetical protein [Lysobacter gummosus]|uniref:hypothetical protein n=1 Tax=Lysobacter gummosus TaxID=262324 RepID=UPI003630508D
MERFVCVPQRCGRLNAWPCGQNRHFRRRGQTRRCRLADKIVSRERKRSNASAWGGRSFPAGFGPRWVTGRRRSLRLPDRTAPGPARRPRPPAAARGGTSGPGRRPSARPPLPRSDGSLGSAIKVVPEPPSR